MVSLIVSAVVLAVATTVVPVRVRLGTDSFTCPTVVRSQQADVVASAVCEHVGAYRLRATLAIGALLAALSLVPLVVQRRRELMAWAGATFGMALLSIGLLALVGGRWERVFFDL